MTIFSIKSGFRTALKSAGIVLFAAFLASCTSSGTNKVDDALTVQPQDNQQSSTLPTPDKIQDPRAYCPKIVQRAGTEVFDVYPKDVKKEDEGSAAKLRWRATITEFVRECNYAGNFLNIRVGVRGRYLSGPTGESGSFEMPVRIAVTRGEDVLFSQLYKLPATLSPGQGSGTFSHVENSISIPKPTSENIIIYVGFDEGPYDTP
jgi:hypothetical protein